MQPKIYSRGRVLSSGDGIVRVDGLSGVKYGELIAFEGDRFGIALNLEKDAVGVVLFNGEETVGEGMMATGTGNVVEVPVGKSLLGRVVNPLGLPLDHGDPIHTSSYRPIETEAPSILSRKPVSRPLQTGLLAIDSMVPIGRGQRELIIGDRQTGKTAIALDTILNQKGKDVICVYVAIGQKASTVTQMVKVLKDHDAMDYTVIVTATAADSAPMQYIAPYAGCAIAEEFMYSGKDVLIVYDDLSKHAVAYRAMSLLLRRPPGREAYPGDIFYLHSRLLERSAQLSDDLGGGSMTALPIVETLAGDISAYIPTNIISITDGQIFLESELFHSGVRPAINVGLSISRVGGAAQLKYMRQVSGKMRLDLSQFRELAVFAQFGSDLDVYTQKLLEKGSRLTETLKQRQYHPLAAVDQAIILYTVTRDLTDAVPLRDLTRFYPALLEYIHSNYAFILEKMEQTGSLSEDIEDAIRIATREAIENLNGGN